MNRHRPPLAALCLLAIVSLAGTGAAAPAPAGVSTPLLQAQFRTPLRQANAQVTTNTDTALIAAPGAGRALVIYKLTVDVWVGGTSSKARVEDGAGGDVLATALTTVVGPSLDRNWVDGVELTANTALNLETSGSAAAELEANVYYQIVAR